MEQSKACIGRAFNNFSALLSPTTHCIFLLAFTNALLILRKYILDFEGASLLEF